MSVAFAKSADWIAERRTYFGGTDAASIMGFNPKRTPLETYMLKTGEISAPDLSDGEKVQWGLILEDPVADEWARRTGKKIRRVNRVIRHPKYPFMGANIDRAVVGENAGLEVKTTGEWVAKTDAWGEAGTDKVPPQYLWQAMHYMAVCGWERCYFAVLVGGQEFREYIVPRDEELIELLIETLKTAWAQVEAKTPPPPLTIDDMLLKEYCRTCRGLGLFTVDEEDGSTTTPTCPACKGTGRRGKYDGEVEAPADVIEAAARCDTLKREIKEREAEFEANKFVVCGYLDASGGDTLVRVSADGSRDKVATWKWGKPPTKFSAKEHAEAEPDCHKQFMRRSMPTRTFLLKDVQS